MTVNAGFRPAKESPSRAALAANLCDLTVGAKAANTINVAGQLKDAKGRTIAERVVLRVFLSDSIAGAGITATATTSALAMHTNGLLLNIDVTGKMATIMSDAVGRFDMDIIQTASPVTQYLVLVMPDGSIIVSGVITF